jgi:membrane-bound ClpP family serine protease
MKEATPMKLTWKDGITTMLAGLTVAVAVAVTQEWDWPLLGSVTAGVGVLGAIGWAMCIFGGSGTSEWSMKNPYTVAMSALGSLAIVLIVVGLITGSETVFVTLAVVTVVMWLASTTAHAVAHAPVRSARPMRPVHMT